ncbi:MAG: glycosyltransferase family 9 protein [Deltaproteobacteria bacterium]|nr:glycosyltransferase family 9 protein [Deltaproteobacteria bacterium]
MRQLYRYAVFFSRTLALSSGSFTQSLLHALYERHYPARKRKAGGEINILVVQLGQIGDFVLSAPLFEALKSTYGKRLRLTVMTDSINKDLAGMDMNIDKTVFYDSPRYSRVKGGGSVFPYERLKEGRFDEVIWLRGDMKVFIWMASRRVPMKSIMKFPNPLRSSWLALITGRPSKKKAMHYLETLDEVCKDASPSGLFRAKASNAPAAGMREVMIHIGSGNALRRWPEERFSKLCSLLAGLSPDISVSLIGSKEDRQAGERIATGAAANGAQGVSNLCGAFMLTDLYERFRAASLYIGFDSGPMHMAASAGAPLIALMGPQSPQVFGPRGQNVKVIHKGFPCSPCWQFGCVRNDNGAGACVLAITPEEVFREARAFLEGSASYAH